MDANVGNVLAKYSDQLLVIWEAIRFRVSMGIKVYLSLARTCNKGGRAWNFSVGKAYVFSQGFVRV